MKYSLASRCGASFSWAGLLLTAILTAPLSALAHHVKVSDLATAQQIVNDGGRLVADYGSYQIYDVDDLRPELIQNAHIEVRDDFNHILLNAGKIDTSTSPTKALRKAAGSFPGKHLHLIQFVGPIKPEWHAAIRKTGVTVIDYIPANAYLVYGDAAAIAKLQKLTTTLKTVQWDGVYEDTYKIHPTARLHDEKGQLRELPAGEFAIQLVNDPAANQATLAVIDKLKLAPVRRQTKVLRYLNVIVQLNPADVAVLAAQPEVISIRPYRAPHLLDEVQDQIIAGNIATNAPVGPGYLAWLTGKGFTQGQFTASGFAVDISDSGIDNGTTSPGHFALYETGDTNLPSRVIYNRLTGTANNPGSTIQGCDGHGNINTHIVAAFDQYSGFPHLDPNGYYYDLGVCPFVQVGSSVIFDPNEFTNPDYADLMSRAYQDGSRISNNSWGSDVSGEYDSDAQAYDALVRDAQPAGSVYGAAGNQEMVIVFAAGNSGPDSGTIGSPGSAKNVITVGGSMNVRSLSVDNGGNNALGDDGCEMADTEADNTDNMEDFSSRGPCADGRSKPDLVAPCTHVTGGAPQTSPPPDPNGVGSSLTCFLTSGELGTGVCGLPGVGSINTSNFFPVEQQFFTVSSGTSHATPAVAGACALVRQYFINQSWPVPSPAMTKALLMNTARYLDGTGANDTLWSDNQGMGELDLGTAFANTPRVLRDQLPEDLFTATGQSRTYYGAINDPNQSLRVTLAWTDAPGSTTGPALNNDLDLTVTVAGNTYYGNVFSGKNSVTGGQPDHLNNVESVYLPAGIVGNYTITVTAANINSDGVPGNDTELDQDFALVIDNAVATPAPNITIAASALVGESCTPTNGAIDPGETVAVDITLVNVGSANTMNLTATLQATGGVTALSSPQVYGVLTTNSPGVTETFTFTANGNCGGLITNTFQLQDGPTALGTATIIFSLGQMESILSQGFASVTNAPALPKGWATAVSGKQSPWVTTTNTPGGAFSPDPGVAGVNELDSPPILINTASAQLTFHHMYNLEASTVSPTVGFDGGVLEIKIGKHPYVDILKAGGSFVTGGYNRVINKKFKNPLEGRAAWSGDSAGYITTIVNLPEAAAGQTVQLRWRCGSDRDTSAGGWYIDSVSVTTPLCCTTEHQAKN